MSLTRDGRSDANGTAMFCVIVAYTGLQMHLLLFVVKVLVVGMQRTVCDASYLIG